MNAELNEVFERATQWPAEDQLDLILAAIEIETRRQGAYRASSDELIAIDEALAAVMRGEVASDEDVAAVAARYSSS
ncbi:MAG: hypothetical protein QOI12_3679 [Alphaproteobacteria bacterium]|jgi:hypothetical protein|nr:hypothetical protein [Alphaproteobacteria bacterium]